MNLPTPRLGAWLYLWLLPLVVAGQPANQAEWANEVARYGELGQWDSLDMAFRQHLDELRKADRLAEWLFAAWDWQAWYFDDTHRALRILDQALQNTWRKPTSPAECEAMLWIQTNRGYHLFQLGSIVRSVEAYEDALRWFRQCQPPDFDALEYLFLPLGAHYTRLGDNEKARTLYELAIASHRAGPHDAALAGVYNNLGLTWWNEGQYTAAVEVFRRGLACRALPADRAGLLHLSLAQSFFDMGMPDSASIHLRSAFRLFDQASTDPQTLADYRSGAWLLQGQLLAARGRHGPALDCFARSLDLIRQARGSLRHRDAGKILVAMGYSQLQSGQAEKALATFHQALTSLIPVFSHSDVMSLPRSEDLYEENTLMEALEGKADAAGQLFRSQKDTQWLDLALRCHELAQVIDSRLRLLLQYQSSKLALQLKTRQRIQKAIDLAWEAWEHSPNQAYLWKAWQFAEQGRAAVLLENLLLIRQDAAYTQRESNLRRQLAWYERQLLMQTDAPQRTEWLRQRQLLLDELDSLQRTRPAWQNMQRQLQLADADSLALLLADMPQVVLEYFSTPRSIYLFRAGGNLPPRWYRVTPVDTLLHGVRQLLRWLPSRTALDNRREDYCRLASDVCQTLVHPATEGLPSQSPLLIIPDGMLAFLPFEALLTAPHAGTWQQAPWLLRQHPVQYAFSLMVFQTQRQLPAGARRNLLQVAPVFDEGGRNLPPLLNSLDETPRKTSCRSARLLREQATFAAFDSLAPHFRVLHLSTHAAVDSATLQPRIEFFDRAAWLPDIYAMQLHADLVVLSACETGLGRLAEGEGVLSLSRAFTWAGVRGLVSSQWTINETATARILQQMYQHLQDGQTKAMALHRAKIDWLDDPEVPPFQKSPYFWAALVYVGDSNAVVFHSCLHWWILGGIGMAFLLVLLWKRK